jgi:hypothetical protein
MYLVIKHCPPTHVLHPRTENGWTTNSSSSTFCERTVELQIIKQGVAAPISSRLVCQPCFICQLLHHCVNASLLLYSNQHCEPCLHTSHLASASRCDCDDEHTAWFPYYPYSPRGRGGQDNSIDVKNCCRDVPSGRVELWHRPVSA